MSSIVFQEKSIITETVPFVEGVTVLEEKKKQIS